MREGLTYRVGESFVSILMWCGGLRRLLLFPFPTFAGTSVARMTNGRLPMCARSPKAIPFKRTR
jgi:hypothetical protein